MALSTSITRISDQLPLAASIDDDQTETSLKEQKQQSKLILRRISSQSESKCSIESGSYTIHYLLSDVVCYLCISDKSYPRNLAFSYLDELDKEFKQSYTTQLPTFKRPYAAQSFENFISKTQRVYIDPRAATATQQQSPYSQLNDDLQDVTRIMTKNIEDLLWRGDSLDKMSHLSTSLKDESFKYKRAAKKVNLDALIRKYSPLVGIAIVICFVLYWKFL
ncbi:hypothetical protein E3P94_01492 [Wallemia ichthyophaga]|nr:hypothetical protein E3P95_01360 [Wallemia ichthyophaga]TIB02192.1 hypothetical protein E3P94_01492 [Wallemia ichthyophaga]